jgi:hypothetical protein
MSLHAHDVLLSDCEWPARTERDTRAIISGTDERACCCGIIIAIVRARVLGFFATGLLVFGAPQAWAQSQIKPDRAPILQLTWSAPADCPDGEQIRAEVLRLADADAQPSRHLKAEALLRADDRGGWTLALTTELDGMVGERHLMGASCQSLGEAATLTLALILNPQAKLEPTPKPAAPPVAQPIAPAPAPPPEPWPPRRYHLGALAGVQLGVLEDASPWLGLSLGWAIGRFSARVLPGFAPPQNVSSHDRADAGGRLWMLSAAALACYAVVESSIVLVPCAGANLVRLHGRGWGVRQAREATVTWTSAELALQAALPLGRRLSLEVWGFGLVPLYTSSVYLDEAGLVSRPARFGFGTLAGFSLALP